MPGIPSKKTVVLTPEKSHFKNIHSTKKHNKNGDYKMSRMRTPR